VRVLVGLLVLAVLALASFAALVLTLSRTKLVADPVALAHIDVGKLGGKLESVTATGPRGGAIPLDVRDGHITPARSVPAGTTISVDVRVKRPGWYGWAVGNVKHEQLQIRTPSAKLKTRWTNVRTGAPLRVAFDTPVRKVAYGTAGHMQHATLRAPLRTLSLGRQAAAGTLAVAAVPRVWEQLPRTKPVTWFPAGKTPTAVASPASGAKIAPTAPIRLTFSQPVGHLLGSARPTFTTQVPGRWRTLDSHTLQFTPSGMGFGFGAQVHLTLPKNVGLAGGPNTATGATGATGGTGGTGTSATQVDWTVPPGSPLRMNQLLAQLGYLPLTWKASGADVGSSTGAQLNAAVDPPKGDFSWRYAGFPSQLTSQWNASGIGEITRGALLAFQTDNGLNPDALPGPNVWTSLITALAQHKTNKVDGYNYVLVHRDAAQQTTELWHNGKQIFSTPANTGVAAAPTDLGTFPVYLRYQVTTMSGTNPDGSRYSDPGIKWVSYFNGGDALHAFDRASYGTPQSVGCVEMPEAAAAKIYPYTPIGTLVTIAP
jgi:L,D-transpeptidase catalytic domain